MSLLKRIKAIFDFSNTDTTTEDLNAYRKNDPDFEQAITDTATAEVSVSPSTDPAEGRVVPNPGVRSGNNPAP